MRKRMWIRIALGTSAFVVLGLGGAYHWWTQGGLPQRSGSLTIPALDAPVRVRFDAFGVPHVTGESMQDLSLAMGFLHANDRMFQLELLRRAGSGRLSEAVGPMALGRDIEARVLRFRDSAERMWKALGPESRELLEAYAQGVNAWLEERDGDLPPDLRLLGIDPEPWQPIDSLLAHFLMARDLTYPRRYEERRFAWLVGLGPEKTLELLGDPEARIAPELEALAETQRAKIPQGEGEQRVRRIPDPDWPARRTAAVGSRGSNNWVVGSSRSQSGYPIVASDPHLSLAHPGFWYQATLRASDYEATGMTLPGLPIVVIGQAAHLAWAFTNGEIDVTDLFFEELDEEGTSVRRGGAWRRIHAETEWIPIRGRDPFPLEVRETDIGPLLDPLKLGYVYSTSPGDAQRLVEHEPLLPARSLAWTAYYAFDPIAVFLGLARAKDLDAVERSAADFLCPLQNLVVGTRDGQLLSTFLGRLPERRHGDGRFPGLARDTRQHWNGLQSHAASPRIIDPPEDMLATANADPRAADYQGELTGDFASSHRRDRIRDELLDRSRWSVADMARLQADRVSLYAREVCAYLRVPLASSGESPTNAEHARRVLADWDGDMQTKGPAALFAIFDAELTEALSRPLVAVALEELAYPERIPMITRFLAGELTGFWSDDPRTEAIETADMLLEGTLARAWERATSRFGEDPALFDYGALHTWLPYHPMNAVPFLGTFFQRGPHEVPGSGTTIGVFSGPWTRARDGQPSIAVVHGASMRWIADTQNPDNSTAILPVGQSGHPFDEHYDDQLELYLQDLTRPVLWSEEAIGKGARSTLELHP